MWSFCELGLSESFVECDGGGVCQIVAARVFAGHGNGEELRLVAFVEIRREAVLFVSEDEEVSRLDLEIVEALFGLGGEEDQPRGLGALQEGIPVLPEIPFQVGPVVQSRAAQMCVVNEESQWLDEMEGCVGVDAESADGAGVLGDFRRHQDDMEGDLAVHCRNSDCLPLAESARVFWRNARNSGESFCRRFAPICRRNPRGVPRSRKSRSSDSRSSRVKAGGASPRRKDSASRSSRGFRRRPRAGATASTPHSSAMRRMSWMVQRSPEPIMGSSGRRRRASLRRDQPPGTSR